MIDNILVNKLQLVKKENIDNFLKSYDWSIMKDFSNKNLTVYLKDNYTIVIPSNEHFTDFIPKLYEALKMVCEVENRLLDTIINEIISINIDKFSIRFITESTKDGRIPMNHAVDAINAVKDLIISAACNEENPRPFYRKATNSALQYSDVFKFAQTSVGSFVMNIESEYDISEYKQLKFDESILISEEAIIPFERKILNRLIKGFKQIEDFNTFDNIDEFIEVAYLDGINANMCDAILNLRGKDTEIDIESSFKLSDTFTGELYDERIELSNNSFHLIEAISKAYRKIEDIELITLYGKVSKIEHNYKKHVDFGGYVTLNIKYPKDNREHNVKAYLEQGMYRLACDAIKHQTDIKVKGKLDKSNRIWYMDDITEFSYI